VRIPPLRDTLFFAAFVALYVTAYLYCHHLPAPMPIWLPDAVLLSALLLTSPRRWVGLIVVVVVIRLLPPLAPNVPFIFLLLFVLADLIKAFIAVLLLHRFGGDFLRFDSMRAVGTYIACAVIAAPALSATIGAAIGVTHGAHYGTAWIIWFLGDALACLLIAPALLLWVPRLRSLSRDNLPGRKDTLEALALAAGLLFVGLIIFTGQLPAGLHSVTQVYLITPLLLTAAVRFGPPGISAALACVALLAITGAAMGIGPFVGRAALMNIIPLQIFLAVTAVPLLLLAAVIVERTRSRQDVEALASRLLQMQDDERRSIARELHDSALQTATATKLDLHRLRTRLQKAEYDEGTYVPLLDESESLTDQVITDLRTLSYLLHPPMLEELGLAATLEWYVEGFAQQSNLRVELQSPDELGRLPRQVEMTLYRVAQEGLTNVYRHSGSSSARVTLSVQGNVLSLRIQDWGRGIAARMAGRSAPVADGAARADDGARRRPLLGVGIIGMRRRLHQLGGRLEIDSTTHGTTITAIVPLAVKARNDEASGSDLKSQKIGSP
jgi:signal transduction histidine kinase